MSRQPTVHEQRQYWVCESSQLPNSGSGKRPVPLNIEHSHGVDYVIQAQYQLFSAAGAPSPVTQISGTLTGSDDISISGASLSNLLPFGLSYPVVITVQLTDKLTGATTSGVFGYSNPDTAPREP